MTIQLLYHDYSTTLRPPVFIGSDVIDCFSFVNEYKLIVAGQSDAEAEDACVVEGAFKQCGGLISLRSEEYEY